MTDDPNLKMHIQKNHFLAELAAQEEENNLLDRIADRMLQRITLTTDFQKAIMEIHEVKKALDSLGK